ncbi:trypco2 family protein [Pseudoalteromonas rubra]|uniref:trypco2 family protein n=1 Tax=Pseudoalteromonas rubra TaxID=43658 RepID=UPI002DB9BC11|nr:trypco2 family protein [Pseudoalteromonas rubra]MEC4091388.1 trypco2 family protein [Pseudoalteromonas rubra]
MSFKENISLKDFIEKVKSELKSAVDEETPFFLMDEVELEVSFTLDIKTQGSAKLVVLDVGGDVKASQVHRVKLKLTPFHEPTKPQRINQITPPKPPCG